MGVGDIILANLQEERDSLSLGSPSTRHCEVSAPMLVTSPNQEGTLPALIKKGDLGKTGAD